MALRSAQEENHPHAEYNNPRIPDSMVLSGPWASLLES
jgi:hypothetical protein